MTGVSFVVPVHNGRPWLRETLKAICDQADGRPMEVIVVDDHSVDGSGDLLQELSALFDFRLIRAERHGAAAALNAGIDAARYPIVCQVDQDVIVQPGWMPRLTAALEDRTVAAAQGYYCAEPNATLSARAMNLDLEQRYAAIDGIDTDHVCTGNTAYRLDAVRHVGLFDETLGYGYDNDLSYRLHGAGYRLVICRDARSVHRWRDGITNYLLQQYGFGYGRLDLVAKYPRRAGGDSVSPTAMMAHPLILLMAIVIGVVASITAVGGGHWQSLALAGVALFATLVLERLAAGLDAAWRFRQSTPLVFPFLHIARDFAWVAAIGVWTARRLAGNVSKPSHSMHPRLPAHDVGPGFSQISPPAHDVGSGFGRLRVIESPIAKPILCVIPAHNEAASLPAVVNDIRKHQPNAEILVIDDGSTDNTSALVPRLGVRWIQLTERMGIGTAMRAGLRYAARTGYDIVVRMDGDGQHRAEDVDQLVAALTAGADVVLGSRFVESAAPGFALVRVVQRTLAACLSMLTGGRVTDPTSGFCALGPRAVHVLAEHHPTGYPEPELRLFLSGNGLTVVEAPVSGRARTEGTTSLTPRRMTVAGARVLLAMIVVPLRRKIGVADD